MNAANGQDLKTACLTPTSLRKENPANDCKCVSRADIGREDLTGFMLGHYELGKHLGTGGMGVVYAAKHLHLGKSFAVKFIRSDLHSEEAVARFLGEIATLGCLQHPNLINAVDAGVEQNLPHCVTELLNGHDLARWIIMRGIMPVGAAAEVISQALAGIAFAHERGIIHRDIKPSNLFLQHDGSVRVLDFGLSLSDHNENATTQAGQMLGTIDFMPPEQIQNAHAANELSDVYALAATMVYLVCGQPPYPGTKYPTAINKLHAIGRQAPEGLEPESTTLPKSLKALLIRCLDAKTCNRPKTAEEFRAELQSYASSDVLKAWMAGKKAHAAHTSGGQHKIRFVNRWSVAVLTAVLLIAVCAWGRHARKSQFDRRNAVVAASTLSGDQSVAHASTPQPAPAQAQATGETAAPTRHTIDSNVPSRLNANAMSFSSEKTRSNRASDRVRAKALDQKGAK